MGNRPELGRRQSRWHRLGAFSAAGAARLPGPELGDPAIAPTAGAITSHSAIVTTMDVAYPKGLIRTSLAAMPAKIISSQALTKCITPAAGSLKNALISARQ
jgi:hypothetical protein